MRRCSSFVEWVFWPSVHCCWAINIVQIYARFEEGDGLCSGCALWVDLWVDDHRTTFEKKKSPSIEWTHNIYIWWRILCKKHIYRCIERATKSIIWRPKQWAFRANGAWNSALLSPTYACCLSSLFMGWTRIHTTHKHAVISYSGRKSVAFVVCRPTKRCGVQNENIWSWMLCEAENSMCATNRSKQFAKFLLARRCPDTRMNGIGKIATRTNCWLLLPLLLQLLASHQLLWPHIKPTLCLSPHPTIDYCFYPTPSWISATQPLKSVGLSPLLYPERRTTAAGQEGGPQI